MRLPRQTQAWACLVAAVLLPAARILAARLPRLFAAQHPSAAQLRLRSAAQLQNLSAAQLRPQLAAPILVLILAAVLAAACACRPAVRCCVAAPAAAAQILAVARFEEAITRLDHCENQNTTPACQLGVVFFFLPTVTSSDELTENRGHLMVELVPRQHPITPGILGSLQTIGVDVRAEGKKSRAGA